MVGAQLGKTLSSPCRSLDKLNLRFRAAARITGATRCVHRAAALPTRATRRRSCQRKARSQQVGSPADYSCTVSAPIVWVPPAPTVAVIFSSSHTACFFCVLVLCTVIFLVLSCILVWLQSSVLFVFFVCYFLHCYYSFGFSCCFRYSVGLPLPRPGARSTCLALLLRGCLACSPLCSTFFLMVFPVAVDPSFLVRLSFFSVPLSAEHFLLTAGSRGIHL